MIAQMVQATKLIMDTVNGKSPSYLFTGKEFVNCQQAERFVKSVLLKNKHNFNNLILLKSLNVQS